MNVIGLMDVHDREPTMMEQSLITPEFVSGRTGPLGLLLDFGSEQLNR